MDGEVGRALHAPVDLAVVRDVQYVAAVGEKDAALRCHAAPPAQGLGLLGLEAQLARVVHEADSGAGAHRGLSC